MGVLYHVDRHVIVPYQDKAVQEIITRLQTKLSVLQIHEPTLEDAYVNYLMKDGGAIA